MNVGAVAPRPRVSADASGCADITACDSASFNAVGGLTAPFVSAPSTCSGESRTSVTTSELQLRYAKTSMILPAHSLVKGRLSLAANREQGLHPANDLSGPVFGRLLAIEARGRQEGSALWKSQCSCSKKTLVSVQLRLLASGVVRSCGSLCDPGHPRSLQMLRGGWQVFKSDSASERKGADNAEVLLDGLSKACGGGFEEQSRLHNIEGKLRLVEGTRTLWCKLHDADLRLTAAAASGSYFGFSLATLSI
jgi:hypothetical protein